MKRTSDHSLVQLGVTDGLASEDFPLASRVRAATLKPLDKLNSEELRLLISQSVGAEFVVPIAIERIEANPLLEGDFYPGDVLQSMLTLEKDFWDQNPELLADFKRVLESCAKTLSDLVEKISAFEAGHS